MAKSFWHKLTYLPMAAVLLAGWTSAAAPPIQTEEVVAESYNWNFPSEASTLLREIKSLASQLDRNADTLAALAANHRVSSQSHAHELAQIRQHINTLGPKLARLQEIKHVTAPWQQMAMERVEPVAVELAARTEAALQHLTDNGTYLFAPSYREDVAAIRDQAGVIKDQVVTALAYADAQQRVDQLQDKLGLSES